MASFKKIAQRRAMARNIILPNRYYTKLKEPEMFYFRTRTEAREFAKKRDSYTVVDCRENPNVNGLGWAVKVL